MPDLLHKDFEKKGPASENNDVEASTKLKPETASGAITGVLSRHSARNELRTTLSNVDGDGYYLPRPSVDDRHLDSPSTNDNEKCIEVTWDGDDDPMNPKNKRTLTKWTIVLLLACGSLCVTCVSSIYTTTVRTHPSFILTKREHKLTISLV